MVSSIVDAVGNKHPTSREFITARILTGEIDIVEDIS